jgi:glutathione synthase/RimK-type ligase-like ATP-grasp enzyme
MDKDLIDLKNSLMNTEITNETVALNVLVSFLNLAQRRGIFSIDESAKIWECINKFQKAQPSPSSTSS